MSSDETEAYERGMSVRTARKLIYLLLSAMVGVGYIAHGGEIALPTLSLTGWLIPCALWIIILTAMFMWNVSDRDEPGDRIPCRPNWILEMMRKT